MNNNDYSENLISRKTIYPYKISIIHVYHVLQWNQTTQTTQYTLYKYTN